MTGRFRASSSRTVKIALLLAVVTAAMLIPSKKPVAQRSNPFAASAMQAPKPMCTTASQPNLGTIAGAITQSQNGPFISDYNKLSEAAWCTFIALNFQAAGTNPTMNGTGTFGNCTSPANNCPTVWETWLQTQEVYCSDGSAPNPNNGCSTAPHAAMVHRLRAGLNGSGISVPASVPAQEFKNFKSTKTGKSGTLTASGGHTTITAQATGFELPDKNYSAQNENSLIVYEGRDNPPTVNYLIQQKLYSKDGQVAMWNALNLASSMSGAPPAQGAPSGVKPTPIDFPGTSFELKPSWYIFAPGETNTQYGMFTTATAPGSNQIIGLTGFHILWKVFPKSNWFWATFEYENMKSPAQYNNMFFAPILSKAVTPWVYNPSSGPYVPYSGPDMITAAAAYANNIYRPMTSQTVFSNYKLVGVQVAGTTPDGKTSLLANNHMETDFGAKSVAGATYATSSSCVTCHYNASIGSVNTTSCVYNKQTGAYQSGSAYFRRVPVYQRTSSCAEVLSGNLPTGYTGAFQPSLYQPVPSSQSCYSRGSFLAADFVWSMQNANWQKQNPMPGTVPGTGCQAMRQPAAPAK